MLLAVIVSMNGKSSGEKLMSRMNISCPLRFAMSISSSCKVSWCRNPAKWAGSFDSVAWRKAIAALASPSSFSLQ